MRLPYHFYFTAGPVLFRIQQICHTVGSGWPFLGGGLFRSLLAADLGDGSSVLTHVDLIQAGGHAALLYLADVSLDLLGM